MASGTTVIAGGMVAIVRALDARGQDGLALARDVGIDVASLSDPNGRIPVAVADKFMALAVEVTSDDAFPLSVSRFLTVTSFHALMYACLASPTLGDALERYQRYQRVSAGHFRGTVYSTGTTSWIEIQDVASGDVKPRQGAMDFAVSIVVRGIRDLLADPEIVPASVEFVRSAPVNIEPFRELFGPSVRFSARRNALAFPQSLLATPLPSANTEIARESDRVLADYLGTLEDTTLSGRVRRVLSESLPQGAPSKADVAKQLGMSERNFHRRLAADGTSYRELLGAVRVELAQGYLEAGALTITEISFLLGFSETSTFCRAFRRWTGISATHYPSRAE